MNFLEMNRDDVRATPPKQASRTICTVFFECIPASSALYLNCSKLRVEYNAHIYTRYNGRILFVL
jgi:hypothetical protein